MLNEKFKTKVLNMTESERLYFIGQMAYIIDTELDDVVRRDDSGKMLPRSEQQFPYIETMMEILEYD